MSTSSEERVVDNIEENSRLLHVSTNLDVSGGYGSQSDAVEQENLIGMTVGSNPKSLPQIVAALAASGGALVAGTALGWSSQIAKDLIENEKYGFEITNDQFSWFSSITNLGAGIMCIPTGYLCGLIGRKFTMLGLAIPLIIGWILVTFSNGIPMILAGRFLLGVGAGGFCVAAPMYTGEIASKNIRGTLGSFFQLMITIGILVAYILGAYVPLFTYNLICLIFPIIFVVIFVFMPESPRYLISVGKETETIASLQRLRGDNYDITSELNELKTENEKSQNENINPLQALKGSVGFRSLCIGIGLMLFQQLSGVNAVIFYSGSIFADADTGMPMEICTVVVGIVQVLATFVSVMVVDKAGRKLLLILSAFCMAICTICLGVYFFLQSKDEESVKSISWLPLASLIFFICMFSIGFGPVPWLMMGEIFSHEIKSVASALCGTTNWMLAFIVTKAYGPLKDSIGGGPVFWIFSAISLVGALFVYLATPETKGKTLNEVQLIIGRRVNKSTQPTKA